MPARAWLATSCKSLVGWSTRRCGHMGGSRVLPGCRPGRHRGGVGRCDSGGFRVQVVRVGDPEETLYDQRGDRRRERCQDARGSLLLAHTRVTLRAAKGLGSEDLWLT